MPLRGMCLVCSSGWAGVLGVGGGHGGTVPSRHALPGARALHLTDHCGVDLGLLAEVCLSGFSTGPCPRPHCSLWKEVTVQGPH